MFSHHKLVNLSRCKKIRYTLLQFFLGNTSADKTLNQTLQQELEHTRLCLNKIFHDILANTSSRDAMLNYLATLLRHNEKRAQLQTEERTLAGDGFMLNLLSVLQLLAVRIKLDKIDVLYPFHPSCLVEIKNDTRLRFTSQEVNDWLEELSKCKHFFKVPTNKYCHYCVSKIAVILTGLRL